MAMFPALMNDTMFSDLFDDPFFEGWRNMDRAAACDPNMSAGMMSTDVRETDKGYMVEHRHAWLQEGRTYRWTCRTAI